MKQCYICQMSYVGLIFSLTFFCCLFSILCNICVFRVIKKFWQTISANHSDDYRRNFDYDLNLLIENNLKIEYIDNVSLNYFNHLNYSFLKNEYELNYNLVNCFWKFQLEKWPYHILFLRLYYMVYNENCMIWFLI